MQPATFTWRGTVRPLGLVGNRRRRRHPRKYGVGASERTYQLVAQYAARRGVSQQRALDLVFAGWRPS